MSGEAAAPTPQCQFFVQRKKRLCRMTVKPGRQYCGEHEPLPKTEAGQTDKRIPCPNDPKHTVYASKLLKHLAICNARQTEQPPYIKHNINAPEAVETCPRRPLSSIPKDEIAAVVDKVNRLYAKHLEGHIREEPPQPIHRTVLPEFSSAERAESSRRHLRQVSALLWATEAAGLARERTCYVELGAGKGQLSFYACHAWCAGASRVLAVDRAPLRHKRDNKLRSAPPTRRATADPHSPTIHNHHFNSNQTSGDSTDSQADNEKTSHKESRISERMDIGGDSDNPNLTVPSNGPLSDIKVSKRSTISNDSNRIDSIENKINAISNDINDSNTEREVLDDKSDEQKSDTAKDIDDEKFDKNEDEVAVRLRADLAHLALEAVPVVAECAAVVGIAKHLCGVATDFALRCVAAGGVAHKTRGVVIATCCHHRIERALYVANTQLQVTIINFALRCVAAGGVAHKTRGVVIATCCHHRIERALYVANTQLQELGIDAEDLNIMLGIVSWATCGDGRSRERRRASPEPRQEPREPREPRSLSREEQETAGRRAKALLDWGRILWLRERGFDARLAYYVPKEVSLENAVIIASKR